MVDLVGWFNGNEVQIFLRDYNAEMTERGVDEATRLDFFCRVAAVSRYEEVKELTSHGAHESRSSRVMGVLLGSSIGSIRVCETGGARSA